MSIDSYDLDKLRYLLRQLSKENERLKEILRKADIPFESQNVFEEKNFEVNYDEDQPGRIIEKAIDRELARQFYKMFWGRTDVFARRSKKGAYYPQCDNRFNDFCPINTGEKKFCEAECPHRKWKALESWIIIRHLKAEKEDGSDVIGTYPLLPDGTCRFIVFDFDNHEQGAEKKDFANTDDAFKDEVNALRKICKDSEVPHLVERSRSGNGAHVWIFFEKPISAKLARNFGFLLLEKGMTLVNLRSFRYYDRMYPCQDYTTGIGNLIALPLQGDALRKGNSAFIDEDWNAYPDQWDILLNQTKKLSKDEVLSFMAQWQDEIAKEKGRLVDYSGADRPKPWRKNDTFLNEDVVGKLHITLSDGLYIDTLNLMPRIQNQIRCLAAFDNPIFYKNKALGYSNYYNFSSIYLGKDINGYIRLPRGLKDKLLEELRKGKITYEIEDERQKGRPIRVGFKGDLKAKQDLAASDLFEYDNGILNAATGFGKTVIASYMIAKRKVNTLIILQNSQLIQQWIEELERFLEIKEKLPEYETKTGRKKKRDSLIGVLQGNRDTLSGIVDIAMVGSLYRKGNYHKLINSYGMVIVDECHHSASNTFVEVLNKIDAKYVYGLSANLKRSDHLDKITLMMIGEIRHRYTALQRAIDNKIEHQIVPRFTRVIDLEDRERDINGKYELVCSNLDRNKQIIEDVKKCLEQGRTPLILTRYKEHARKLHEQLEGCADHVLLVYGDNKSKENKEILSSLKQINKEESILLIATMQMIGEGFDFPRLDTLMLAAPVSHESRLEQYVGRIDRVYEGKKIVYVYDYVDEHIASFANMYKKRLKTYKKIGFTVSETINNEKQSVKAIYDSFSYAEVFEQDLIEASKSIVISSPSLDRDKVERMIKILRSKQEEGVRISVLCNDADYDVFGDSDNSNVLQMIVDMKNNGFNVITRNGTESCFCVIDDELVWYGGANLLGKEDIWDNLIRVKDDSIAAELLEEEHKIAKDVSEKEQ